MNISRRQLKILTIAVLVGLAVFSVFALILKVFFDYPNFNPTAYITAISLLAIAILTIVYTLMASGQLEIMKKQLDEMHKTRQLESQPLPVVDISSVSIEPPRVFHSPSGDRHTFHTRIRADFSLINHTSHPAVNLVASGLIVLKEGKTSSVIRSTPEQLDILAADEIFPSDEEERNLDFLFLADKDDEILSRFQKKSPSLLPVLHARIVYRNVLGACFAVDVAFRLIPAKQEDEETLKEWQSHIVSFPVEYKDKLAEMAVLKKDKKETQWKKLFNSVEKAVIESTGEEDLEITFERLPTSFKVQNISMEEYSEELKTVGAEVAAEQ